MLLGVPDEDGEWQYDIEDGEGRLYHQRRNDEVWYYTYDSLDLEKTLFNLFNKFVGG